MNVPERAGDQPIAVNLEEGKTYAWCACGLSKNQPYCDGAHTGTAHAPKVFKAEASETKYLCNCKQTKNGPYCDGSHSS